MSGGLFRFRPEQHANAAAVDGFGQKAALFKADGQPGGAPMKGDTAWRSMYSGHIKALQRYRPSSRQAVWRLQFLPTPVGPEKRKLPIGLSARAKADATF